MGVGAQKEAADAITRARLVIVTDIWQKGGQGDMAIHLRAPQEICNLSTYRVLLWL